MKKTLSLILAVMMLLGCMSVTAFAASGGVSIGGTKVSPGEVTGNAAITGGTVTFTAATETAPAKLTLNNATITGNSEYPAIQSAVKLLEIELTGDNTVTGTEEESAILIVGDLTFSGTGTLIAHGSGNDASFAIKVRDERTVTLPAGYKAVGSTSATETDITKMTEVTLVKVSDTDKTYMVGEAVAQTVAIYNSNAASGKSGNTDITLTVAKSLTYDMVIPEDVTNLDAAGIYSVGQAKVTNVKNATDKTVISYTAETTAFKSEGKTDIPASYYTDEAGQNAFPTTAVEVYKSKADAASIPTMWVKIAEEDWNAAENGTYTATVTYNFSAEEVEKVTIADILPEEFPDSYEGSWWRDPVCRLFVTEGNLIAQYDTLSISVPVTTVLTPAEGSYTCTVSGVTWTFTMEEESFGHVAISGCTGGDEELNGTYGEVC